MTIQILRLKDGCDIICNTQNISGGMIELEMPMAFELIDQRLILQHWLPLAAMKGNSVKMPREEIVCYMEPNDNFITYYDEAVKKVSSALDSNNEEEIEEMVSAMEELENSKGILIH